MIPHLAKQHAQSVVRHSKLVEGLIYLDGQKEVYFEDSDMTYPFRQRRYFYYLSGVNEPGCHLTYDIELDHLTLYIPPISPQTVIWFGRGSTVDEAKHKSVISSGFNIRIPAYNNSKLDTTLTLCVLLLL